MANNCFKDGDIVIIKSGSPKMTVIYSDDDDTSVVYYDYESKKVNATKIATIALELCS